MNASKTAVLMDSGGDLSYELCKEEGIFYLPLHVIYPEKDYRDGIDIDPMMIYDRFPDEIPSTSTPSVWEVQKLFDEIREAGYENLIAVVISSALSSTGNTVRLAANDYKGLDVFVFDTKNISFGSGIFALWAVRKLNEGVSFEEMKDLLVKKRPDSRQFFYMDTLKYLRHGGRIGLVSGFVGEMLHIKPIISCNPDGVYYTVAKIRGAKFAKKRMLEEVLKVAGNCRCWIVVGEGKAHEEALEMKEMVMKSLSNAVFLFQKQIAATLANNTGPGLVGVLVFREP